MLHFSQSVRALFLGYGGCCADRLFSISIPCPRCGLWLLQPHRRYSGTRGDPPHPLYPYIHVNFPGSGVRLHLCPECMLGSSFHWCFYSHHIMQLFPIYNELIGNTQRRMNIVIGTSIGSAIGVYETIGVFGYLTFGSKVCVSAPESQACPHIMTDRSQRYCDVPIYFDLHRCWAISYCNPRHVFVSVTGPSLS